MSLLCALAHEVREWQGVVQLGHDSDEQRDAVVVVMVEEERQVLTTPARLIKPVDRAILGTEYTRTKLSDKIPMELLMDCADSAEVRKRQMVMSIIR